MKVALLQHLFLSTLVVATVIVVLLKNKPRKREYNLPPSPPKLPILRNLHQLGKLPHISLHHLVRTYGPIIFLQLGEIPTVVFFRTTVSSARMAKEVMTTHDLALLSRPQIFSAKHLFYDCTDVVFSPYGAYWRHIRRICILELLRAKRVQSYSHVRSFPGATNLTKLFGLYANDVLCRVAFRRDFSGGGDYDRHGFQKMLEEYQELLGGFSIGDFFPSMEFIHSLTGTKSRLQHTFQRFDNLFDEILRDHQKENKATELHKYLVDVLLDILKNGYGDMPLTRDNVKAIILDMFAAGTDATFITLDWGMTELVINQKATERAQAEVRSVVGERKFVQETDLPQLQYLKAVINEIFRLYPPAPVKTRFFVNAWSIGWDPESWVDPESFQPERFLNENSDIDFKGQDFELIPFGAGRRSCPVIAFGNASVELALAQLLHSFNWELPDGIQPKDLDMTEVFAITMHRIANLMVAVKPRFS
ncbi:hypothetical protein ACJRO7_009340 [Eucalyptus globulus]|uniref:Cytochrome P450 n=1 Tax=Eucalyptus globulus TaxID=34317 RepID=A0ABD3L984_EUCGL